jgi:hypothetical protein
MSTNVIISRKNWFRVKDHPAKWMIWGGEPVKGTVYILGTPFIISVPSATSAKTIELKGCPLNLNYSELLLSKK